MATHPNDGFGINVRVTRVAKDGATSGEPFSEEKEDRFFNCLACGHIHDAAAMRRSAGVCHACGTMVRRAAAELLEGVPEGAAMVMASAPRSDAERRADALRDALVRFDEESSARTMVIDDQGEYYDLVRANAWLDEEEGRGEVARERARERVVGIDLLGRRFVVGEDGDGEDHGEDDGALRTHTEVSELERPWGGGRGLDGCLRGEGKRNGNGSGNGNGNGKGVSGAFVEFLEGRGVEGGRGVPGGAGGLRFVSGGRG